jgi:hypothetical protein
MTDRFDLEDRITKLLDITENVEDLIYKVGDSPQKPSEDDLLNALIGLKSTIDIRYERLWTTFEQMITDGQIKKPTI